MSIDLVETIEVIGLPDACIDRIEKLTPSKILLIQNKAHVSEQLHTVSLVPGPKRATKVEYRSSSYGLIFAYCRPQHHASPSYLVTRSAFLPCGLQHGLSNSVDPDPFLSLPNLRVQRELESEDSVIMPTGAMHPRELVVTPSALYFTSSVPKLLFITVKRRLGLQGWKKKTWVLEEEAVDCFDVTTCANDPQHELVAYLTGHGSTLTLLLLEPAHLVYDETEADLGWPRRVVTFFPQAVHQPMQYDLTSDAHYKMPISPRDFMYTKLLLREHVLLLAGNCLDKIVLSVAAKHPADYFDEDAVLVDHCVKIASDSPVRSLHMACWHPSFEVILVVAGCEVHCVHREKKRNRLALMNSVITMKPTVSVCLVKDDEWLVYSPNCIRIYRVNLNI